MPNILNPKFKYTHSSQSNVAETFKKHGHKPPCAKRQAKIKKLLNCF